MKRLLSTIMLLLALTVGTWAQNTLPGRFSVSDTKQVYFSKGNLQYIGTTWQFAEHQYDYFGPTLSPERETVKGKWFDLQGRQLPAKPARGIYIENRQKKVK